MPVVNKYIHAEMFSKYLVDGDGSPDGAVDSTGLNHHHFVAQGWKE